MKMKYFISLNIFINKTWNLVNHLKKFIKYEVIIKINITKNKIYIIKYQIILEIKM